MKKRIDTTEVAVASKPGRPSKFTPAMARQVRFLTALGAIDEELADFFEVSVPTLDTWKKVHDEFLGALKEGKAIADSNVERALYQRATGYSHPDVHISNFKGEITVTPITKHFPPDTTACIFWLKNRMPVGWRDKIDVSANQTGTIEIVIGGDAT